MRDSRPCPRLTGLLKAAFGLKHRWNAWLASARTLGMRIILLLVAAAAGGVGCAADTEFAPPTSSPGSIPPPPPEDVEPPLTPSEFQAVLTSSVCEWVGNCASVFGDVFGSPENCTSTVDFFFASQLRSVGDIDDLTLFRLEESLVPACTAEILARPCSDFPAFEDLSSCQAVIQGRLRENECCDVRRGCEDGFVCEREDRQDAAGECSQEGISGDTCYVQPCAPGLQCINNRCADSLGIGPGERCDRSFDCQSGLVCIGQTRVCSTPPELGEVCDSIETPCAAGLFCHGSNDGSLLVCNAAAGPVGRRCRQDVDCSTGLVCSRSSFTCFELGTTGAACTEDEDCAEGLLCLDGTCETFAAPTGPGDPCRAGFSCPGDLGEDLCVEQADGGSICVASPEVGDACGSPGQAPCPFVKGLFCNPQTSQCQLLPALGDPCAEEMACRSAFSDYCDIGDATPTCKPRLEDGVSCVAVDGAEGFLSPCRFGSFCLPSDLDDMSSPTICRSSLDLAGPTEAACQ